MITNPSMNLKLEQFKHHTSLSIYIHPFHLPNLRPIPIQLFQNGYILKSFSWNEYWRSKITSTDRTYVKTLDSVVHDEIQVLPTNFVMLRFDLFIDCKDIVLPIKLVVEISKVTSIADDMCVNSLVLKGTTSRRQCCL